MYKTSSILLVVVLIIAIFSSNVNGYRYFKNRWEKIERRSEARNYERWLNQTLDHFNPNDERQWQQRYFVNDEFATNATTKKIAFLLINGEGEASSSSVISGSWYIYGKKYEAHLFSLEHRYYGQSHPTPDTSIENLVYLSSQQALADVAFFISAMNKEYKLSDVKWIVFGGSYAGSLAAWARKLYPHLIQGAMSASGPLLAQLDYPEYLQVVEDVLRNYSGDCANAVKAGVNQVEAWYNNQTNNYNLTEQFRLCDDTASIYDPLDLQNFYESLADNYAYIVQYNHNHRPSTEGLNFTVEKICEIMTDKSIGAEIFRMAKTNAFMLDGVGDECFDYKYDKMINELTNTSWNATASEGGRQWTYQTCTEFGFYQTTHEPQLFGNRFDLDFFIKQCQDIFGPEYDKTFLQNVVDRTNVLYGARDIDASNIVFVNGGADPWHVLGKTESQNPASPAIVIEGAAHCSNMYDPSVNDTPQLTAAREQIDELIGSWIN